MSAWWESLTNIQQILAFAAIPATIILLLQTMLLLFGMGSSGEADGGAFDVNDGDFDTELHDSGSYMHHDSGLQLFTVRAFVTFFSIFGWLGIVLIDNNMNNALAITIAFIAGLAATIGTAYFFKFAMRLQSAGNIDIRNSKGKTATVYIPIPPKRAGKGKVTVIVQGRFTEADAVTDSDIALKTGTEVVITSISNHNVLCVTPANSQQKQ